YNSSRSTADNLNNQLNNYSSAAQAHLDNLAGNANFRAGKLKKASFNTGVSRGLALTALTFGAGSYLSPAAAAGSGGAAAAGAGFASAGSATSFGASLLSSLGTGLRYMAPVVGLAGYMGSMKRLQGVGSLERTDLRNIRENYGNTLAGLSSSGISHDKIGLPDLGGLKQSLFQFGNMPTVPRLQDLPKLSESLGKIVNPKDVENVGLGLPQMTSADGKKYSSEVLYDMDFLKKLKKVSRALGTPYLRSIRSSVIPNNVRGNIAYA
ncbi:MAG TPA: hypothetical protein LFW21_01715, partial [Rickettsia endosymbiont of Pyrocoelia pectoralis]|nr:hypothetical protein [Rickettsia endosymbiont of Pyrocoelia pectoralis]